MSALPRKCVEAGNYRYTLWRSVTPDAFAPKRQGYLLWVMLNPSTATESKDDPTLRKVKAMTARLGWAELCVCNLFALRSTEPKALLPKHGNPLDGHQVGAENDYWLRRCAEGADEVACAWGTWGGHAKLRERTLAVRMLLSEERGSSPLRCLGTAAEGEPLHPLMLPYKGLRLVALPARKEAA